MTKLRVIVMVLATTLWWPGSVAFASQGAAEFQSEVPLLRLMQRAYAKSQKSRLALADLVTCAGAEALCDEAYGIDVGAAPEPGRFEYFDRDTLQNILDREWPMAVVELEGAARTRIEGAFAHVDESVVEEWFAQAVQMLFDDDQQVRATVRSIVMPRQIRIRPGDYELRAPEILALQAQSREWRIRALLGHKSFRILVQQVDGAVEFNLRSHVEVERRGAMAASSLAAGRVIGESDVVMDWVALKNHSSRAPLEESPVGRTTRRHLRVGAAITSADLAASLAVRRGSMIEIALSLKGISAKSKGKALGQGSVGEAIIVELPSKKKIRATIVAKDKVQATL